MIIFDHFRLILGYWTVKWPFLGMNMYNTLFHDHEYELNKEKCFVDVISFSKIYKSLYKKQF
jgi:hypothetical protein